MKVLTLSLGHKLQINTDYVEGYCVKFFKACQSAPLSSLLCCGEYVCIYTQQNVCYHFRHVILLAILLLVVVTILVWLISAFGGLSEYDIVCV